MTEFFRIAISLCVSFMCIFFLSCARALDVTQSRTAVCPHVGGTDDVMSAGMVPTRRLRPTSGPRRWTAVTPSSTFLLLADNGAA